MADDKRAAKRKLEEMLMEMSWHRSHLTAHHNKGDAFGVARYERLLRYDHSLIRKHCAKNDLELPREVPDEEAG